MDSRVFWAVFWALVAWSVLVVLSVALYLRIEAYRAERSLCALAVAAGASSTAGVCARL